MLLTRFTEKFGNFATLRCCLRGLSAALLMAPPVLLAQTPSAVELPSLEMKGGQAIMLRGLWFAAQPQPVDSKPRPTVVLLHGCGGAYDGQGRLSERMRAYSTLLTAQGWHALVLDSLTPRGEREICTQKIGTRQITMTQRRLDTLGALQWLARRADVDAQRLVLLGWSNGGSAVLASTNLNQPEVKDSVTQPRAAVAFYPGCAADLKRGYAPSAPLLMLVGANDDWTPAAPCEALAVQSAEPKPHLTVYPGAYHGFDGTAPIKLRTEVPNGVRPGAGVHVGGQALAREASSLQMLAFLHAALD